MGFVVIRLLYRLCQRVQKIVQRRWVMSSWRECKLGEILELNALGCVTIKNKQVKSFMDYIEKKIQNPERRHVRKARKKIRRFGRRNNFGESRRKPVEAESRTGNHASLTFRRVPSGARFL